MISKPCMHSIVTVLRITNTTVVGYLIQKGYSGLSLQRKFLLTYTKCSSLPVLRSMLLSYHIVFQICISKYVKTSVCLQESRLSEMYTIFIEIKMKYKLNGNILIRYYITNITLHFTSPFNCNIYHDSNCIIDRKRIKWVKDFFMLKKNHALHSSRLIKLI